MTSRPTQREADQHWSMLNAQFLVAMKANNWGAMKQIYFEQAFQLWREGKSFFRIAQESRRAELRTYDGTCHAVQILTAGESSCPSCRALEGKQSTLKQALETMPIPMPNCTNDIGEFGQQQGWCRCIYEPVIND